MAVLGFDVVWAERDPSSGIEVLDALARDGVQGNPSFRGAYARLRAGLDFDARFAASLKGRPVVLGYYFNIEERAVGRTRCPRRRCRAARSPGATSRFPHWRGYTGNLPIYLENAAGAGHINPLADFDGVSRRVPMLTEFDGAYYEALSLAMVRACWRAQPGGGRAVGAGLSRGAAERPGMARRRRRRRSRWTRMPRR